MKITDVKVVPVNKFLFVKVMTDEGITGLGESGDWGFLESSAEVINSFREYLIGQDPLRIEHHWQYMYRCFHFRGGAERHRHRAVGHCGQILRGAGLPASGRQMPGHGAGVLPRVGRQL